MKIKIKKLNTNAVIPSYSKDGDACMDLTVTSIKRDVFYVEYGTGLAVEIPKGFFGLIRPRSSVSSKELLFKTSGVVDSGYRGELTVRFQDSGDGNHEYAIGDRCAQFMVLPYPTIEFIEVEKLSTTERGVGGHGSSGK